MERWRNVAFAKGLYEVSNLGRVRRTDKGNLLTATAHTAGYSRVCMSVGGKPYTRLVHILVAEAFLGMRPKGHDVNHKNGIKTDNHVDNLEYLSRKQHEFHTAHVLNRQRSVVGEAHGNARLSEGQVRAIHAQYCTGKYTMKEIAREYDVTLTCISSIVNGYSWSHLELPKPKKRKYHPKGMDNPNAKVTPEMAQAIREKRQVGHTISEIAKEMGIGRTTVHRISKPINP